MKRPAVIICVSAALAMAALAPRADAGVVTSQIQRVEAVPAANATLPLDLGFSNDTGQPITLGEAIGHGPAVVVFVDYTCRTLCGPILELTLAGLSRSGLRPGNDYRLIAIGIDPRDSVADAQAIRAARLDQSSPVSRSTIFLTGGDAEVHAATQAAGFRYVYDAEHDQFAHPAAVYVVDGEGRIGRVLSPLGLDGADLRLAIVDAAQGSVGTLTDRIHLLCYGYDPVRGIYTERITTILAFAAGMTLVAVLTGISFLASLDKKWGRS